jgi:hypothetical protein
MITWEVIENETTQSINKTELVHPDLGCHNKRGKNWMGFERMNNVIVHYGLLFKS